jgi:hypothetical protein
LLSFDILSDEIAVVILQRHLRHKFIIQ